MASCLLGEESLAGPLKRTHVTTTRFMEASRRMAHQGRDTLVEEAPAALPLRTGWAPQGSKRRLFRFCGQAPLLPSRVHWLSQKNKPERGNTGLL